jgi:hypothetical protein
LAYVLLPAFPRHDEEHEGPVAVDITGLWAGPQAHIEDFYAGTDARTLPGQEIDPTLLDGTGRHNMGVPSATQTVTTDEQDYEEDPIDEEEQLEDEVEYDGEAIIQPPTRHMFVPTSRLARRAFPIPTGAEFISIDDSDEETGLEDHASIALEPLEVVVEMEYQELQHEDAGEQNMEREHSVEVDEIVNEDTAYMQPLSSAPLSDADIPIATWPLSSPCEQQDDITMDYDQLYANIEAAMVQPDEQAGILYSFFLL